MPHHEDDGFHEIQLNGKQLVFLFMAATVASVVIFLCGVLVGRGVRAERAEAVAEAAGAGPVAVPDVVPPHEPVAPPAGSDPTAAAPPPVVDELSYFNRLEKKGQPEEDLKPAAGAKAVSTPGASVPEKPVRSGPPVAKRPAPASLPGATPPAAAATASSKAPAPEPRPAALEPTEPVGSGFALQVTALRELGEAEAVARRLSAKGYAAYVVKPAASAPSVYRVRVGKFKTRREAEAVATKLQKEEQFTPWITR